MIASCIACEELMQQVGAHKQQRAEDVYNLQSIQPPDLILQLQSFIQSRVTLSTSHSSLYTFIPN